MDIPFNFRIFDSKNTFYDSQIPSEYSEYNNFFFKNENNYSVDDMITITENKDIVLEFKSVNGNARLYMDSLDYYQSSICKEDTFGNIYIDESLEPIVLYKNGNSKEDYYPFIPGIYQIYVNVDSEKYFALIKVQPKQITTAELDLMRSEIEDTIENLAHMLVTNESVTSKKSSYTDDVSYSSKLLILVDYFNKIILTIKAIHKAPRYKIINDYQFEDINKVKVIDQETIKHRLKKTNKQNKLFVPKRITTRNLPENILIIKIIKYVRETANDISKYLERLLPHIEHDANLLVGGKYPRSENESHKYNQQVESVRINQEKIRKILATCNLFLRVDWIEEVEVKELKEPTHGFYLDNRYRFLYKVYRELKQNKKSIQLDSGFAYRWKRTDKLYEMWGFITLLKALQSSSLKFQPIKGWIYDDENINNSWKVPLLNEGETITLVGPDEKVIKLVYDKPIVYDKKLTSFDNPLYTQFPNNRPDARIDFYCEGMYEASFIIDFKYRPARAIGNLNVNEYTKDSTIYKQILHYSKFDSEFVRKTKDYEITDKKSRTPQPVAGVWVVYPNHDSNNEINKSVVKKDWLTKIPFSPGENIEKLEKIIFEAFKQESLL